MSTNHRLLALGLAGASALALALGGASAAQADSSRVLSQITFVVPAVRSDVSHLVSMRIAEPNLPASAFDAQIWCEDGNTYQVPLQIVNGTTSYVDSNVRLPSVESGRVCNYTIGVTSEYHTGVVFDKIGVAPEPGTVFMTGMVTNGRPRPTY
jgi:hypothetical protein